MKNSTTRKALLSSVVALVICVTMLMGTTFAWFTDTATVAVNSIQSGTLKIDLVDADGNSLVGAPLDFIKKDNTDKILWEPGCTYDLPEVYVENLGNLAVKYEIVITGIKGDAKLNDAIEWDITYPATDDNGGEILADGVATGDYFLLPEKTSGPITISGHMKEEAGNEYQGLTIDGIAITVAATQYTYEYDSEVNTYDADADYDYSDLDPNNVDLISDGFFTYNEATKTYTIVAIDETVDYVGATIDLTEGYDAEKSTCRWTYTKADGTEVDDTWLLETERSSYFIQNINGREIYQLWIRPDSVVTYYFDMDGDGAHDFTVVFNALESTLK